MKVQYQADADLNHIIVRATLRLEPSIDFRTAAAAGLAGVEDEDVLARMADGGRILVTHDRRTMPHHFARFIASQPSPGVIVVPQKLRAAQAAEELVLIWSATEAAAWVNRIVALPL